MISLRTTIVALIFAVLVSILVQAAQIVVWTPVVRTCPVVLVQETSANWIRILCLVIVALLQALFLTTIACASVKLRVAWERLRHARDGKCLVVNAASMDHQDPSAEWVLIVLGSRRGWGMDSVAHQNALWVNLVSLHLIVSPECARVGSAAGR